MRWTYVPPIPLSEDDFRAVEFVRGRYAWGEWLSPDEDGVVRLTRAQWKDWKKDCASDTEGGHSMFPCAASALHHKLVCFYHQPTVIAERTTRVTTPLERVASQVRGRTPIANMHKGQHVSDVSDENLENALVHMDERMAALEAIGNHRSRLQIKWLESWSAVINAELARRASKVVG